MRQQRNEDAVMCCTASSLRVCAEKWRQSLQARFGGWRSARKIREEERQRMHMHFCLWVFPCTMSHRHVGPGQGENPWSRRSSNLPGTQYMYCTPVNITSNLPGIFPWTTAKLQVIGACVHNNEICKTHTPCYFSLSVICFNHVPLSLCLFCVLFFF